MRSHEGQHKENPNSAVLFYNAKFRNGSDRKCANVFPWCYNCIKNCYEIIGACNYLKKQNEVLPRSCNIDKADDAEIILSMGHYTIDSNLY